MKVIRDIVLSEREPNIKSVGWLYPVGDGTFKLKFYSSNGWIDAASGAPGPAGADGKSITALTLTTNETGGVTGGTATLSDGSEIQITIEQGA